jgi:hypothetical protein
MGANNRFRELFRGLIQDPAVSRNPNFSNDYLDFLCEYEAMCETALAREPGSWGDCLMKKPRVENLVTLSL